MLVILPEKKRTTRNGVAFVVALPLVPAHAGDLEAVELNTEGRHGDVVLLDEESVERLHDTTGEALRLATPGINRSSKNIERFALRRGVTLAQAVKMASDQGLVRRAFNGATVFENTDANGTIDEIVQAHGNETYEAVSLRQKACRRALAVLAAGGDGPITVDDTIVSIRERIRALGANARAAGDTLTSTDCEVALGEQ